MRQHLRDRVSRAGCALHEANPALIHYLMIGMTSMLSSLEDEILQTANVATDDPAVIDADLGMIDTLVFRPARPLGSPVGRQAEPNDPSW